MLMKTEKFLKQMEKCRTFPPLTDIIEQGIHWILSNFFELYIDYYFSVYFISFFSIFLLFNYVSFSSNFQS